MKTIITAFALILAANLSVVSASENPDLYSGHGARLVTDTASNINANPDLYGNGYGEPSVSAIQVESPKVVEENPDLYGGV